MREGRQLTTDAWAAAWKKQDMWLCEGRSRPQRLGGSPLERQQEGDPPPLLVLGLRTDKQPLLWGLLAGWRWSSLFWPPWLPLGGRQAQGGGILLCPLPPGGSSAPWTSEHPAQENSGCPGAFAIPCPLRSVLTSCHCLCWDIVLYCQGPTILPL